MLPLVNLLGLLGVIFCALTALRQIDLKKIVAYSSVSHMNLGILGLCSFNLQGLEGFFFLMLAHGFVSAALFFLVGSLYDRFHTKLVTYYGGLAQLMPLFSIFFFFFTLANFSFPGTSNFIGEFLLLLGIFKNNLMLFILSCIGVFFGAAFSIFTFNKVTFGPLKKAFKNTSFVDLSRRESFVLIILALYTLLLGLYPNLVLNYSYLSIKLLLNRSLI